MKRGARLAVAIVWVLAAMGCTSDGARRDPDDRPQRVRSGGRVTFGILGEPATMDPYGRLASDLTIALTRPLYPSLFRMAPDGSTEPYLAESITTTSSGVRIELAEMSWSDGTDITASDVLRTWRRAELPSGLALATEMRVERDRVLRLVGEDGIDWETALALRSPILPRGRVGRGTYGGPFVVAEHTPGLKLVLEPNPEWGGEPPDPDRIVVRSVDSVDIMLRLLSEGQLHAAAVPSTVNLESRLRDQDLEVASALGWETIRLETAPGRDSASLSAAHRLLDREGLAEGLVRDEGKATETLWPRTESADGSGSQDVPRGMIPDRIALAVPRGDEGLFLLQRAMQLQLIDSGVDVDIIETDLETFYGRWRYSSPADLLLTRATVTPLGRQLDPVGARRAFPLFQVSTFIAWAEGISGLVPNPTPDGPLWNAQEWSRL